MLSPKKRKIGVSNGAYGRLFQFSVCGELICELKVGRKRKWDLTRLIWPFHRLPFELLGDLALSIAKAFVLGKYSDFYGCT